jgi:hypothetical protein
MAPIENMTPLGQRRQQLLLESELHREVLGMQVDVLRLRLGQVGGGLRQYPGVWKYGLPVLGFLAAWRMKRRVAFLAKGSVGLLALIKAWRVLKPLLKK